MIELTKTQEQIMVRCAPSRIIKADRNTGKTTALMALATIIAQRCPGSNVGFMMPTFDELKPARDDIVKMSNAPIVSDLRIEFYNGSLIKMLGSHEARHWINTPDLLLIDEPQNAIMKDILPALDYYRKQGTYIMAVGTFDDSDLQIPEPYEVVEVG